MQDILDSNLFEQRSSLSEQILDRGFRIVPHPEKRVWVANNNMFYQEFDLIKDKADKHFWKLKLEIHSNRENSQILDLKYISHFELYGFIYDVPIAKQVSIEVKRPSIFNRKRTRNTIEKQYKILGDKSRISFQCEIILDHLKDDYVCIESERNQVKLRFILSHPFHEKLAMVLDLSKLLFD